MNKEYEMGDVIALQDIWTPHAQSFLLRNFGMPLGNDSFVAWGCASDSVVEAFIVRVSRWYN